MNLFTYLLYRIECLFDDRFPKYKHLPYRTVSKPVWAVGKRRLLFFYKPLTHTKVITRTDWVIPYRRSHEILMFDTPSDVESEIDRLSFGYKPITERIYYNGELKEVKYG
jgi:hypothetical protein